MQIDLIDEAAKWEEKERKRKEKEAAEQAAQGQGQPGNGNPQGQHGPPPPAPEPPGDGVWDDIMPPEIVPQEEQPILPPVFPIPEFNPMPWPAFGPPPGWDVNNDGNDGGGGDQLEFLDIQDWPVNLNIDPAVGIDHGNPQFLPEVVNQQGGQPGGQQNQQQPNVQQVFLGGNNGVPLIPVRPPAWVLPPRGTSAGPRAMNSRSPQQPGLVNFVAIGADGRMVAQGQGQSVEYTENSGGTWGNFKNWFGSGTTNAWNKFKAGLGNYSDSVANSTAGSGIINTVKAPWGQNATNAWNKFVAGLGNTGDMLKNMSWSDYKDAISRAWNNFDAATNANTRLTGLLRGIGGIAQALVGVALAPETFGAGLLVTVNGLDDLWTGLREMAFGTRQRSAFAEGVERAALQTGADAQTARQIGDQTKQTVDLFGMMASFWNAGKQLQNMPNAAVKQSAAERGVVRTNAPRTFPAPGTPTYGAVDSLGRPTGIQATITSDVLGTGSHANPSIHPPGFGGGAAGHARGHLLGRQLGGSGTDARNLVTLAQNPTNTGVMSGFEGQVARAVRAGEVVQYTATPIYQGNSLVPRGVTLSARGDRGFTLDVTVINFP